MKCSVCGDQLESVKTDLPFKVSASATVIIRDVPVLQCRTCPEYLIEDPAFQRVEELLESVDRRAAVEVIEYAA